MKRALVSRTLSVAVLTGLLVAAGCTNSDPLTPAAGDFQVAVEIVNAPTRFDQAFFVIRQIEVEPLDPQAQGASGTNPVGLINPRNTFEVNGNDEGLQFEIPSRLSTGQWRLKTIVLTAFFYEDADPPASTDTCEEFITRYVPDPNSLVPLTVFGRDVVIDIQPDTVNSLTLRFDHQAFFDRYQRSFICVQRFFQGCAQPWCLAIPNTTNPIFDPSALLSEVDDYLEIE